MNGCKRLLANKSDEFRPKKGIDFREHFPTYTVIQYCGINSYGEQTADRC